MFFTFVPYENDEDDNGGSKKYCSIISHGKKDYTILSSHKVVCNSKTNACKYKDRACLHKTLTKRNVIICFLVMEMNIIIFFILTVILQ